MSHRETLNAISDAIAAYDRQPELIAENNKLKDDLEFSKLEIEELQRAVANLRQEVAELTAQVSDLRGERLTLNNDLYEVRRDNEAKAETIASRDNTIATMTMAMTEKEIVIGILRADKESLERQLSESKSFSDRLAEMLKGFGNAISAVVKEPEVSEDKPFPVDRALGMLDTSDTPVVKEDGSLAEPTLDSACEVQGEDKDLVKEETQRQTCRYGYFS